MGLIGEVDESIKNLISVTQNILYEGIKLCKPGQKVNSIGKICRYRLAHMKNFINYHKRNSPVI
jgi:methionine aminopeptidase